MYKRDNELVCSPSDLNAFLENECVPWLDRFNLEFPGQLTRDAATEEDSLIMRAGDTHENRYLAELLDHGADVVMIERADPKAFEATVRAMREGKQVIYQAHLKHDGFEGWADFLFRVEGPSTFGDWHYEVWDTKLARSMKPYFAIQLCCYSEMLNAVQLRVPEQAGIILGNGGRKPLRVSEYWFYYRSIRRAFLEQQLSFDRTLPPVFPGTADYRHWTGHVTRMLQERDDLSLVANIRAIQIERLAAAGIKTVRELAASTLDTVPRMPSRTFERLRAQARLQCASIPGEAPRFEFMPADAAGGRKGFALLPPASPNDVCFDIEGYPLIDGGLEYLLGATVRGDDVSLAFNDWWAHDRQQERASFEAFIDWVYARWKQDPAMHIYHYAAYETTALKRLMCRYASREAELDELLRNHVFVDLYTVVRQALVVGEPGYSLKNIEHLYAPAREGDVATAGESIVFYERWLTLNDGPDWSTSPTLKQIRDYNRADCESTWYLTEWLRDRQTEAASPYIAPDPPKELSEDVSGRAALANDLLAAIPADRSADPDRWRVHELLGHLLEFHRRERKSLYWALFERMAMTEDELITDLECLGGAERTGKRPVPVKQSCIYEYRFPAQECKLHAGSNCILAADGKTRLTIETIDYDRQILTIRRGNKSGPPPDRLSLLPNDIVDARCIVDSIEQTVRSYQATGALATALSDFLHRRQPRIADHDGRAILRPGEEVTARAVAAVVGLDGSALCIQGPPGAGKTTTGGRIIAELLRRGKRVGISSNSHAAICVLMKAAAEESERLGIRFTAAKCGEEDREPPHPGIDIIGNNADVFARAELPIMVGGTAWVFSRPEARGRFDYLFVDEAGQVSVANLVGMSSAARNIVLLGDQMQLSQPIQGVHPGESGMSVLEYYLQDHATIPEHMGIFLPTTWRMRPEICSFISEAVYEGRLKAERQTAERMIRFGGPVRHIRKPAGIAYVPVDHSGNTYESDEEAAAIRDIVRELTGHLLVVPGIAPRPMTADDIIVVAPFNLQVRNLKASLPGIRVGTVDKFQGQQAAVVIFSMTSSEGDACARGVQFLFDKHRLNVAISRAQVLAVIVGNPALQRPQCSTLDQMRAVNLYCRALEVACATAAAV